MKKWILRSAIALLLTIISTPYVVFAQSAAGWRFQQWAGINSTFVNPALPGLFPKNWDINLLDIQSTIGNNYAFFEDAKISDLIPENQNPYTLDLRPDLDSDTKIGNNDLVMDFYTRDKPYYAETTLDAMGPSFRVQFGRHGLGAMTRLRSWLQARIPTDAGWYNNQQTRGLTTVEKSYIQLMAWQEWGIHYDFSLLQSDAERLVLGMNARWLNGYEAVSLYNDKSFKAREVSPYFYSITPTTVQLSYTTGNLAQFQEGYNPEFQAKPQGRGAAFDLGLVYQNTVSDWGWQAGISLNELGAISFAANAETHRYVSRDTLQIDFADYDQWTSGESIRDYARDLSTQVFQDPLTSLESQSLTMGMPVHVLLHGGVTNAQYGVSLLGSWQQGIRVSPRQLQTHNTLTLIPAWEKKWLAAALPLAWRQGQKPQLGGTVRLAFLTLGTDTLGAWLRRSKLSEAQAFAAIKISTWWESRERAGKSKSQGRNKGVKCYEF